METRISVDFPVIRTFSNLLFRCTISRFVSVSPLPVADPKKQQFRLASAFLQHLAFRTQYGVIWTRKIVWKLRYTTSSTSASDTLIAGYVSQLSIHPDPVTVGNLAAGMRHDRSRTSHLSRCHAFNRYPEPHNHLAPGPGKGIPFAS